MLFASPAASALRRHALAAPAAKLQLRALRRSAGQQQQHQQLQKLQLQPSASSVGEALAPSFTGGATFATVKAGGLRRVGGGRANARAVRYVRVKHGHPKPKETKAPPKTEDAAASERTHAANHRLGLSKNALMLRFSNENSYLNWARNGVLASSVGVAMYAQEHHRGAQLSGAGLLLLGFGYIGAGTAKYIYYILRFRQVMELSWLSVVGTSSHAAAALMIWLTATASFLESVPLELDAMLLTEPIIDYLPFRIRQGLIETYSLYLDDLEHHTDEQERVLRAIRGEQYEPRAAIVPPLGVAPVIPPVVETPSS